MQETYITILGVRVYCQYKMNGKPPIILIHGVLASMHTFHKLIPILTKHYSVIAIDLPGFGKSEKSSSFIYSYQNYAQLVIQCIDYFKLDKVNIVGHSMGGQIALNVALQKPDKIDHLILLASSGYLPKAKTWLTYATYLPFSHLAAKFFLRHETVLANLQTVLYDHSYITEEIINEYERPLKEKNFYKALVRLLRYREGDLSREQLHHISKPVLIIWGEEDQVLSPEIGERLAKDLPHATFMSYSKTGHLLTEEKPQEIGEEIINFARDSYDQA